MNNKKLLQSQQISDTTPLEEGVDFVEKKQSLWGKLKSKISDKVSSLLHTKKEAAPEAKNEAKKAFTKHALKTIATNIKDNYEQFIGEKEHVPSLGETMDQLAEERKRIMKAEPSLPIVAEVSTVAPQIVEEEASEKIVELKEVPSPLTTKLKGFFSNMFDKVLRKKEPEILPIKEELEKIEKNPKVLEDLYTLTGEDIIALYVEEERKAELMAEFASNKELNQSEEKAKDMLIRRLSKEDILPLTEEEKEAHLKKMFPELEEVKIVTPETTKEEKEVVLVGNGVSEVKKEERGFVNKNAATPILNNLLKKSSRPVLSLTDTDRVVSVVEEFVTGKNDKGNFRELIRHIPTDAKEKDAYLTRILYGLHAAGIIDFSNNEEEENRQAALHALQSAFPEDETRPTSPLMETVMPLPETITILEMDRLYDQQRIPLLSLGDATEEKLTYLLNALPLKNEKKLREALQDFSHNTNRDEKTLGFRSILYHIAEEGGVLLSEEDRDAIEKMIFSSSKSDFEHFVKKNHLS